MLIAHHTAPLQQWLNLRRLDNLKIGFAPTMGALHEGHLELIRMAKRAGGIAVASIFVNPTQFNDAFDLDKYPRTPGRDLGLLLTAGCDAVLMPSVDEVYPPGLDLGPQPDFGSLDKIMEGAFRPGHFAGVAMVVKRLLDIVQPHKLYMGQKDFQQLRIVGNMIDQFRLPVELVMCPTVREADGLAMSSRNVRLTPEMRAKAPLIHRLLQEARAQLGSKPVETLEKEALERLNSAGFLPEYFNVVDAQTLLAVNDYTPGMAVAICTAAWAGEVRLIDNVVILS